MDTDLRVIVDCLRTAHYSEREIIDYLERTLGVPPDEAARAIDDAR
jgi:hypothetical protein